MSEHLHHHESSDEDIRHALDQVQHAGNGEEGGSVQYSKLMQLAAAVPIPMPITTNRIILAVWLLRSLMWGVLNAGKKLLAFAKEHPWKTLGGVAVSGGCGFLCGYFGSLMLTAGMIYAVKQKS